MIRSPSITAAMKPYFPELRIAVTRPFKNYILLVTAALSQYLVTVTNTVSSLPLLLAMMLTCFLPTFTLGTFRHEYGVSYGYATATAMSALWMYQYISKFTTFPPIACAASFSSSFFSSFIHLAQLHCGTILFHGIRLNTYFLFRECTIPKFRRMRDRIEKRQILIDGSQPKILARFPFLLCCSCLYFALVMPAYVSMVLAMTTTTTVPANTVTNMIISSATTTPSMMMTLYASSLVLTCIFFALGALGDVHKSISKACFGSHHLVTGGIYKYIRHPNYSAEMMGWIFSAISPIWGIIAGRQFLSLSLLCRRIFIPLLLGFVGALGMSFILSAATFSLEVRQKEKYGAMETYTVWVQRSWAGITFNPMSAK